MHGRVLLFSLLVLPLVAGCASNAPAPPPADTAERPAPPPAPPPAAELPQRIVLDEVLTGLSQPVLVTHAGDGSGRIFVVEQGGTVRVAIGGALLPFLDLSDRVQSGGEQGLLGLAFAPDFGGSGRLFASYTDRGGDSVLERFTVADPRTGFPDAKGTVVLTQTQPYANHNGGHIAFGPDGYLYVGLGDGGAGGDPHGNAQSLDTLLGKVLRLDVSGDRYASPSDNPFVDGEGRAEIWALGLRNPWRFSFDRATGDLFIADVGQGAWEEVNRQEAGSRGGENYGWDRWEGEHEFENARGREGLVFPILEYGHDGGHCSVTGGYVYRGTAVPALSGIYLYADYCSGVLWGAREEDGTWETRELLRSSMRISSFGEDEAGELYVVDHGGTVLRVVGAT